MKQLCQTIFGQRLEKYYTLKDAIALLDSSNLIDIGELAEQAISKKSKVERCSKNYPEIDLVSGKQIKHARANPDCCKSNGNYSAWISIRNHISTILAVVTDRQTGREYYFALPYSAYRHVNANTIRIPFYADGRPYKKNKWWKYQISSFKKLCDLAK
jgi:hypothetical protein